MPFTWYIERVEGSINRKGFVIDREEIINTVYYFMKFEINICPYCKGSGEGEKNK